MGTSARHGISRFWASETRHPPLDLLLQVGRGLPLQTRHTPLHSSLLLPGRVLPIGILLTTTARRTGRGCNRPYSLGSTFADRACRLPPNNCCTDSA